MLDDLPPVLDRVAIDDLVERSMGRPEGVAVVDDGGTTTYGSLVELSGRVARALLGGTADLDERRVAFMVAPSARWVIAHWGILRAGGIAVPLLDRLPDPELRYILEDSGAHAVVTDLRHRARVEGLCSPMGMECVAVEHLVEGAEGVGAGPALEPGRGCMIVYTSGSTGRPKGAVWTHGSLAAQLSVLSKAWGWTPDDVSLLVLPLHHVHGIVNVLTCSLWAGATCRIPAKVDAEAIWEELAGGDVSVFMAVPTIYHRLAASWEAATSEDRRRRSEGSRRMRLMVSGSAALPVTVLERWRSITGHTLLERYGMTELGMVLSNPLHGVRIPGAVGEPLPTVLTRIVDDGGRPVEAPGTGHLQVKGPSVFREYWNRPEATAAAFQDGWFATGDVVEVDAGGVHRILGRSSVDFIKTGGEKVSALEIEDLLRQHEAIAECAVVGLPDPEWGERVGAVIVTTPGSTIDLDGLRAWVRSRAAPAKIPTVLVRVEELPRNAMGKVVKPLLAVLFE